MKKLVMLILVVVVLITAQTQASISAGDILVTGTNPTGAYLAAVNQDLTQKEANYGWGTNPTELAVKSPTEVFMGTTISEFTYIIRINGNLAQQGFSEPGWGTMITGLAVNNDANVVLANAEGNLAIVDGVTLIQTAGNSGFQTVKDVEVLPNGDYVLCNTNGDVIKVNSATLAQIPGGAHGLGVVTALGVQSDGDVVVGTSGGKLYLLDSGLQERKSVLGYGEIRDIAIDADDNILIASKVGGETGTGWIIKANGTTLLQMDYAMGWGEIQAIEVVSCFGSLAADLSGPQGVPDCKVDFYDFAVFAGDWLVEY